MLTCLHCDAANWVWREAECPLTGYQESGYYCAACGEPAPMLDPETALAREIMEDL